MNLTQFHLIVEGTYKQLAGTLQQQFFNNIGVSSYQQLNDQQKQELNQFINLNQLKWKQMVEKISDNPQYQSWIYDVLISGDQKLPEDYQKLKEIIEDFSKISRSSKLTSDQKNIQNYKSYDQLHTFIFEIKQKDARYEKLDFDLFYQTANIVVYKISSKDFKSFSKLVEDHHIAWCVKQSSYFNKYKPPYYMFVNKNNNKPFALLHESSHQFKDVHDMGMTDTNPEIIEILQQFPEVQSFEGDFRSYKLPYEKLQHPDWAPEKFILSIRNSHGSYKFKLQNGIIVPTSNQETKLLNYELNGLAINDTELPFVLDSSIEIPEKYKDSNFIKLSKILTPIELFKQYYKGIMRLVSIDEQDYITVNGSIVIKPPFVKNGKLTVKFKSVKGTFNCNNLGLTTLEGCPQSVSEFLCSGNNLTSLQYCPSEIRLAIKCLDNQLTNLDYLPEKCHRVYCGHNNIKSLSSNTCKKMYTLDCSYNPLTTFEGINYELYNIDCNHCEINSFAGLPPEMKILRCDFNKLESITDLPKITGILSLKENPGNFTKEQLTPYVTERTTVIV